MSTVTQLATQWQNPADILSLLLLVGGDIVRSAIAQLFGIYIQPFQKGPRIYLTPVAFSFGWVGYAFFSFASVVGDKQLMPSDPDCPSKVINCSTGYARENRSWLLGRILRDHEIRVEKTPGDEFADLAGTKLNLSLRIDIFEIQQGPRSPRIDHVWIIGWLVILAQLIISIVPWICFGNWGIFLLTACGTIFALFTGSLRQWDLEKWAGPRLKSTDRFKGKIKTKTVCLLRGNGHRHAMILTGKDGAVDLEKMATATSESLTETPWLLGGLVMLWTFLLITVSGLKENTWFLVLIGGLGMVQNIYASAARRHPEALNLHIKPYQARPTIIGLGFDWQHDEENSDEEMDDAANWREKLDYRMTPGVRGAIRELEKIFPKAGVALMQEFFPALVKYEPERYRTNGEKKFWKKAFREFGMPVPKTSPRP